MSRAADLLASWDRQQASYITHRESRFEVMLDAVQLAVPADGVVLDLASGPGSISARLLDRMPRLTVIALDYDPVLLELGRRALAHHGGRVSFVDGDLFDPAWVAALNGVRPDAVLSSTALHWLPGHILARVYGELAALLPAGGLFANADHLRFAEGRPFFDELARRDDERTQTVDRSNGALDWDQWFTEVVSEPEFAALAPERARRFSDRPPNPDLSLDFHVAALRTAGFAEAGPAWQYLDDYVVVAQR
jgi:O-methyltransferase involved in polyketide biosynthesis